MNYDEAKKKQIEEFKKGNYLVLREEQDSPGSFYLIPALSRRIAEESIMKDAVAIVRRLPTRLRILPGGKPDDA